MYGLLCHIVVACLFSYVFFPNDHSGPVVRFTAWDFINMALVSPALETLIFQVCIIRLCLLFIKGSKAWPIVISALIFGLAHNYSAPYIAAGTLAGMIFGTIYMVSSLTKRDGFLPVYITHCLFNSIGFLISHQ
jgi:membrane protease YdiL (CAAX protease family)